jgi:hypothetical protein
MMISSEECGQTWDKCGLGALCHWLLLATTNLRAWGTTLWNATLYIYTIRSHEEHTYIRPHYMCDAILRHA